MGEWGEGWGSKLTADVQSLPSGGMEEVRPAQHLADHPALQLQPWEPNPG